MNYGACLVARASWLAASTSKVDVLPAQHSAQAREKTGADAGPAR